ncbi:NUDIX domain-containing protein [Frigoribacterium sp. CG_9.8]|uniref:NUDIX domain-containing protein n=1 Tax=Frigoribacterium sp. CG_9.8 TaxID=2787733 RepID=UPI0018CA8EF9|nr:NUDIX domain-containing protein [Frigoribacterium sp. CG_9.8]MBG6106531.1 8-oxo-dGTP pyrophosphatase MutT (NUDIX family) [Frigoribacterium sp. CG_9.8]
MPVRRYVREIRGPVGFGPLILPGVSAAVIDLTGRYLLARHVAGDQWAFVGGGIKPLEDPRAALCKEVAEELTAVEPDVNGLDSAHRAPCHAIT